MSHFYYYHFFTDKLLLEHVGLPHVLDLAVLLVIFLAGNDNGNDKDDNNDNDANNRVGLGVAVHLKP